LGYQLYDKFSQFQYLITIRKKSRFKKPSGYTSNPVGLRGSGFALRAGSTGRRGSPVPRAPDTGQPCDGAINSLRCTTPPPPTLSPPFALLLFFDVHNFNKRRRLWDFFNHLFLLPPPPPPLGRCHGGVGN